MINLCPKKCPYYSTNREIFPNQGVEIKTAFCAIPYTPPEEYFRNYMNDGVPQHINLEFSENGKPLRCEQCILRFGKGKRRKGRKP